MEVSPEFEIGIVEYRNIIKVIKETHDYDFSEYTLTSLKRRIERLIQLQNLRHPDLLIERLRDDKAYFQRFLEEVAIESTEMFRDPSFWRYLRDELLPSLLHDNLKIKIWFPSCVSGDELFSLCILLTEKNWIDKAEIVASCLNENIIDKVKSGFFKTSKSEVSAENYGRFQGNSAFHNYYKSTNDILKRDSSLIKNVTFIKQNINFDNSPQDIKLIICRNQLIYFTQGLHDKALKVFSESLMPGGYLVIGVKEQVGLISSKYFKLINENESVYKKI
jgi:chemotaxis protein methyltransferase CheR